MASVRESDLRLAAVRKEEAELQAQLNQALAAAREDACRRCTPRMQDVALRLFALAQSVDLPLLYLKMQGREESEVVVRGWFSRMTPDAKAKLLEPSPDDAVAVRHLTEARKFMSESRLVQWAHEENVSTGIAPTSGLVLDNAGPDLARGHNQKNKYRWVQRCMQRWGGRRARLTTGELLSQTDFQQKLVRLLSPQP